MNVADVLDLAELSAGRPKLVAGEGGLQNPVRWMHLSELTDVGRLLLGHELVLTTGIGLVGDDDQLGRYVHELADARASGLIVELGRQFMRLPHSMIEAANRRNLPLVELAVEIRFVDLTQAVLSRIVNEQFAELKMSQDINDTFTSLGLDNSEVADVLRVAGDLAGCPAVFENVSHQALAYRNGNPSVILHRWEERSRLVPSWPRIASLGDEHWIVCPISIEGDLAGRLILMPEQVPTTRQVRIAERAAYSLGIGHRASHKLIALERQAHEELLGDLVGRGAVISGELKARGQALGIALGGQDLVGVSVRSHNSAEAATAISDDEARDQVVAALRAEQMVGVVAAIGPCELGIVLSLPMKVSNDAVLKKTSQSIHRCLEKHGRQVVIGVGKKVTELSDVKHSLQEAREVASLFDHHETSQQSYFRIEDARLGGLVRQLRGDPRVQLFVERELGPLLSKSEASGSRDLLQVLEVFCTNGGNVVASAKAFGLSRVAFYHRLDKIEQILGCSLREPQSRLSLWFALLALDIIREGANDDPGGWG